MKVKFTASGHVGERRFHDGESANVRADEAQLLAKAKVIEDPSAVLKEVSKKGGE